MIQPSWNSLVLFCLLALRICTLCSAQVNQKLSENELILKNHIHSVISYEYVPSDTLGRLSQFDEYNSEGRRIRTLGYASKDTISFSEIFHFDSLRKVTDFEQKKYDPYGSVTSHTLTQYDTLEREKLSLEYEGKTISGKTLYYYDISGNLAMAATTRGKRMATCHQYTYNEAGLVIKDSETSFNLDSGGYYYNKIMRTSCYTYNSAGMEEERYDYDMDKNFLGSATSTYGDDGTLSEYEEFYQDGETRALHIRINIPDGEEWREYNDMGSLVSLSQYVYDAKGNLIEIKDYDAYGLNHHIKLRYEFYDLF